MVYYNGTNCTAITRGSSESNSVIDASKTECLDQYLIYQKTQKPTVVLTLEFLFPTPWIWRVCNLWYSSFISFYAGPPESCRCAILWFSTCSSNDKSTTGFHTQNVKSLNYSHLFTRSPLIPVKANTFSKALSLGSTKSPVGVIGINAPIIWHL